MIIRRIFVGPEVDGVFTLFAILFVFVGLNTLGLALIGEYVGRIYREARPAAPSSGRPWGQRVISFQRRKITILINLFRFDLYPYEGNFIRDIDDKSERSKH